MLFVHLVCCHLCQFTHTYSCIAHFCSVAVVRIQSGHKCRMNNMYKSFKVRVVKGIEYSKR